jgi:hypothetical protein
MLSGMPPTAAGARATMGGAFFPPRARLGPRRDGGGRPDVGDGRVRLSGRWGRGR